MATNAEDFIFEYFRNGSNSRNMAVNGSVTPVNFDYVAPPSGMKIARVNMHMADAGMSPYGEFGGLNSPLTNGVTIKILTAGGGAVLQDFFDGETWKRNSDIVALAGMDTSPDPDSGTDSNPIRWTISKAGDMLLMRGNGIFRITINDDLTGLDEFYAFVQGVKV